MAILCIPCLLHKILENPKFRMKFIYKNNTYFQLLNMRTEKKKIDLERPKGWVVWQATPFAERKGLVTLQLMSCHWGMQLSNKITRCWHLLNMWRNLLLHDNGSTKRTNLIGHSKFLPWWQLDGCVTTPFLSAKGVACETKAGQRNKLIYKLWSTGR